MKPEPWVQAGVARDEPAAWETLWRWRWFARAVRPSFRSEVGDWCRAVQPVLSRFRPRTIHDAACGMGFKTILLAEQGYELSGSDPCRYAVERAGELAREEGLEIPFSVASFEDVAAARTRDGLRFDCVHSDEFDLLGDRALLERSARGVFDTLQDGGVFVFGAVTDRTREDLARAVEAEWRRQERFVAFPACTRDGITMRELHVFDRLPDAVLQNRIYWIEEGGELRLETSFLLVRPRWTEADYLEVLGAAGFRDFATFEEHGTGRESIVFHTARK